jgi:hypothetical protein
MIDFKQLILPGDVGSDVLAVKHTLRRMAIKGNEAIRMHNTAGPAFVATLRSAQAQEASRLMASTVEIRMH